MAIIDDTFKEIDAKLHYGLMLHRKCMKGELTSEQCHVLMKEFMANLPNLKAFYERQGFKWL